MIKDYLAAYDRNIRGHLIRVALTAILLVCIPPAHTQSSEVDITGDENLYSALDTSGMKPDFNRYGEPQPVLEGINTRSHDEPYKTEKFETTLRPGQQLEYMANMKQGEVLLFSWEVDGRVYFDFHAHQDGVDPDIWIRYSDGQDSTASGSLVAPYNGEHGWFWANMDNKPVNLLLTVSGYYIDIFRVDL